MNAVVNLADALLDAGRRYQHLGRTQEALTALTRLSGLRLLPAATAEEAQARLGEIQLRRRRFRRARRHLSAALAHRPDSAAHHHRMARACQADGRGDLPRAAEHYRRALELDPHHVDALADAGLLAVRQGRSAEGLAWLRRAAEQAPDRADVLGKVVRGLTLAGREDEASGLLRAARFRNPRDGRVQRLYDDFRFRQLRREQELRRLEREDAALQEPVLLPFVRVVGEAAEAPAERADEPAVLPGPHRLRQPRRIPGRADGNG